MGTEFFLAWMKAQWEEGDRRTLLGDNTGGGSVMLWPARFLCAGVCVSVVLIFIFVYIWLYTYVHSTISIVRGGRDWSYLELPKNSEYKNCDNLERIITYTYTVVYALCVSHCIACVLHRCNNRTRTIKLHWKEIRICPFIRDAQMSERHWLGRNGTSKNRDSENRQCKLLNSDLRWTYHNVTTE
jgi:hypothetical protein